METIRIAELLQPFTSEHHLPPQLLENLQAYLDLLLRWNARINLTAVRDPEHIVTRHFGESLFAARALARELFATPSKASAQPGEGHVTTLADVGSGAGFPGVPLKLLLPQLELTLIESQSKKAIFLREVLRTLGLDHAEVFCGRAEQWAKTADVITLRAVERFERVLPQAARLVAPGGRLCLLIGAAQVNRAQSLLRENWNWVKPEAIPESTGRVVLIGGRS